MQYFETKVKKHYFIVTPSELKEILDGFHHVIVTSGVNKDYAESDPNTFPSKYDTLYQRLASGEKLIWKNDHAVAYIGTGVTNHLENCTYKATNRLHIPDFSQPCPFINTFAFVTHKNQLTVSFSVTQFPEYVCGLCLSFPDLIEYEAACKERDIVFVNGPDLDDYQTYQTILSRIEKVTHSLRLDVNGSIRRTKVRVSDGAEADLQNFYFITSNNIKVL